MKNLAKKTEKELRTMLAEKRKAVQEFRFNMAGSKLKNVKEGSDLKKTIARILTELNARKTQ